MHELSIASAIVAIAADHARGRRVTRVDVRIGALRQVSPGALAFAFQLTTEDTELEGAELVVEHVAARVACSACGVESETTNFPFRCACCGSVDLEVTAGDELFVDALELEDEPISVRMEPHA